MFPLSYGKYVFKHEKMPHKKWNYPFAVMDFASAAEVMPEQTRYLFCKTQRARLFASGRVAVDELISRNVLLLRLSTARGEVIAELQVHNDEEANRLHSDGEADLTVSEGNSLIGVSVEVVVIYNHGYKKMKRLKPQLAHDIPGESQTLAI